MKKVIVNGANGFVGCAVVNEMIKNGIEVIAIVHKNNNKNLTNNKLLKILSVNESVLELKNEELLIGADVFYHFAWEGSSGEKRNDVELQLRNVKNTVESLEFAKSIGCLKFVYAGSIMEKEALRNIDCSGSNYIYGSAKLAAHNMCKAIARKIGISPVFAEITNIYGPGEKNSRMVNSVIRKCMEGISPDLTQGSQYYDFIYITDAAIAFCLIGEKGKAFSEYVIGSSNAKPLKEYMIEMKNSIAENLNFNFGAVEFSGVTLPLSDFNCDNLIEDTGFKAKVQFSEGCKNTMLWLMKESERIL